MTPIDLFRQAESLGLKLQVRGDKLRVSPAERCPPAFADLLRRHKPKILGWLNQPPCPGWHTVPPPDLPLNPFEPRPSLANARRIMDYVVRQIGDQPGPLCEWCLRRETLYWDLYRWSHQDCAYAAARDAVCWQLGRDEAAVWGALDECAQQDAG